MLTIEVSDQVAAPIVQEEPGADVPVVPGTVRALLTGPSLVGGDSTAPSRCGSSIDRANLTFRMQCLGVQVPMGGYGRWGAGWRSVTVMRDLEKVAANTRVKTV